MNDIINLQGIRKEDIIIFGEGGGEAFPEVLISVHKMMAFFSLFPKMSFFFLLNCL